MQAIINQDNQLNCPNCRNENLHQRSVDVFFRKNEDDDQGKFISCSAEKVQSIGSHNNPSERRDGLLIKFECEHCNADPELAIYQHKGATYVEWHSMRKPIVGDQ